MPVQFSAFLNQPWSFFTWPLATELNSHRVWGFILNALFIYQFGILFQQALGEKRLRQFLIFCFQVCSIFTLLICFLIPGWNSEGDSLMGISGLMSGVVMAIILFMPRFPVHLLVFNVPLWVFGGIVIALRLTSVVTFVSKAEFFGLVNGCVAGGIYVWGLKQGYDIPQAISDFFGAGLEQLGGKKKKGKFKIVKEEGEDEEAEMNRLLDKISQEGYPQLTKAEKKWLDDYGKKKVEK